MKQDIHPQLHPVVILDTSSGEEFVSLSTATSEQKRDIDGVEHYVLEVEVSSASHPFYTGKQQFVDTARRVEKFQEKEKLVAEKKAAGGHSSKKAKREARAGKQKENKADAKAALKEAKNALKDL